MTAPAHTDRNVGCRIVAVELQSIRSRNAVVTAVLLDLIWTDKRRHPRQRRQYTRRDCWTEISVKADVSAVYVEVSFMSLRLLLRAASEGASAWQRWMTYGCTASSLFIYAPTINVFAPFPSPSKLEFFQCGDTADWVTGVASGL